MSLKLKRYRAAIDPQSPPLDLVATSATNDMPLGAVLADTTHPRRVAILIGPEGGLEPREVDAARARGWRVVGLGQRILRTETAAPAIIAILQSRWGDLGTA